MGGYGPLYTHIAALGYYGWNTIGHQQISEEKKRLTTRDVGGEIYIGDERVGSVANRENVPTMQVMGMPVVHEEIQRPLGRSQSKKPSRRSPSDAPHSTLPDI